LRESNLAQKKRSASEISTFYEEMLSLTKTGTYEGFLSIPAFLHSSATSCLLDDDICEAGVGADGRRVE
jgi:hypothetical protein